MSSGPLATLHDDGTGRRERMRAVIEHGFGVALYRIRRTFRRRWPGYLSLVLLVGLVGGLGLGSLAAARRTQSSFSTFLAGTNPSDLLVSIYSGNLSQAANPNYNAVLDARPSSGWPDVRHVAAGVEVTGAPLTADGAPRLRVLGLAYPVASVNGLFFTQDRLAVTQGRLASPQRPDEIVMAPVVAKLLGFHVGQVIPFGFYSAAQQSLPGFGTAAVRPALRANMRLVGLASLNSEIVEDDVDTLPTFLPLTPAFAKELLAHTNEQFSGALVYGIQTVGGTATVPAVEREVNRLVPPGVISSDHLLAPVVAKADRSLKPISIALGVFGGVALLAALLIAAQLIARRLRTEADDVRVLRALGASPADTILDGLIGLEAAIVVGTLAGGGRCGRAVATVTARTGAPRVSLQRALLRLDGAGLRRSDPGRAAQRRGRPVGVRGGAVPRCATAPCPIDNGRPCRRRRGAGWTVGAGRGGGPDGTRARRGAHRGAGPLHAARVLARRRARS